MPQYNGVQTQIEKTKKYRRVWLPFLAFVAIISGLLQGCQDSSEWKSQKGSITNNSYSPYGGMKGSLFWSIPKNKLPFNLIMDQSSILYYTIDDNQVEALNEANTLTPAVKWNFPTSSQITTSLSMDDDYNVFFGCADSKLYQVRDGALVWYFQLPLAVSVQGISAGPLVDGGNVYVGARDGTVYSLNYSLKKLNWIFKPGGTIVSLTALPGNMLYVTSFSKKVYAIDISGNPLPPITPKWVKDVPGELNSRVPICFPQDFKNLLVPYFVNNRHHIRAFNPNSGIPEWDYEIPYDCNEYCLTNMCADNERLFLTGFFGIKCVLLKNRRVPWEKPGFFKPPYNCQPVVDSKGVLYVPGDKKIIAINGITGQEIWNVPTNPDFPVREGYYTNMIIGGKILYVGDPKAIYAIK